MQRIAKNFLPPHLVLDEQELYVSQGAIFVLEHDGSLRHQHSMTGLLSVQNEIMYVGMNGEKEHTIQAFDGKVGSVKWRYSTEGRLAAAPLVSGEVIIASVVEGDIYALSSTDGSLLWRTTVGFFLSAAPVISDGMIYIAQVANKPANPSVAAIDSQNGQIVWRTLLSESTPWSLCLVDDLLYLASHSTITALLRIDGNQVWQHSIKEGRIYSSPVYSSGTICDYYITTLPFNRQGGGKQLSLHRELFLFALDPLKGTLLWKRRVDALTGVGQVQTFATTDGTIFFATNDGFLTALRSDGVLLWRYQPEHGGKLLSLTGTQDIIYLGANDGYVYGLQAHDGSPLWQTFVGQSATVVSAHQHEMIAFV